MQIIHARAEGDKNPGNDPDFRGSKAIFLKRAFQKPLFTGRCIIIADAFIECSGDLNRQPFLFFLRNRERPLGFAGLYDIWRDIQTGEYLHSFAIITVAANSLVRKINCSRMPVILPRGKELRWLKPTNTLTEILGMLTKYPSDKMDAYPVSNELNESGPFDRNMLMPSGERLSKETAPPVLSRKGHYHKSKTDVSHWLGNAPL